MINEDEIRIQLEGLDIEPDRIEEFINDFDLNSDEIPTPTGSPENKRLELQLALDNTSKTNWRKRAKLASQIVKIGLGE